MIGLSDTTANGFEARTIPGGFSWTLTSVFSRLLVEAQSRYGKRVIDWTPVGVEIGVDRERPAVWFPGNLMHISILLSRHAQNDWREACFELAHETVHVLAPHNPGIANALEEGVACAFADDMAMENNWNRHTADPKYTPALEAVRELLAYDTDAISKLRHHVPAFFDMTPDFIRSHIHACPKALANRLCERF